MSTRHIALATTIFLLTTGCAGRRDIGNAASIVDRDVQAASQKLKALGDALSDAFDALGHKTFPNTLPSSLSTLTIPFDATNLDHRELTDFPTPLLHSLLSYTSEVQALNQNIDGLRGSELVAIPVTPRTTAFLSEKVVPRLGLKIVEAIEIINGKDKGTPQETPGLIKKSELLSAELRKWAGT